MNAPYPRPTSKSSSKATWLLVLAVIAFCGLSGGCLISLMGDPSSLGKVEITNRYRDPVFFQISGKKQKIMPGATASGLESIRGGFYLTVFDAKGKLLKKNAYYPRDLNEHTHNGVLQLEVGP